MRPYRFWFLAGAVWEVIRLGVLLHFLFGTWPWPADSVVQSGSGALMLAASGQLLFPASFVILAVRGTRGGDLLNLVRVGKVLAVASGIVYLVTVPEARTLLVGLRQIQVALVDVILGLDLLGLLILLLSVPHSTRTVAAPLPDYEETEVPSDGPGLQP